MVGCIFFIYFLFTKYDFQKITNCFIYILFPCDDWKCGYHTILFLVYFPFSELTMSDQGRGILYLDVFKAFILYLTYTFHNPIVCIINKYFYTLQKPIDKEELLVQQNDWMCIWQHHTSQGRAYYTRCFERKKTFHEFSGFQFSFPITVMSPFLFLKPY